MEEVTLDVSVPQPLIQFNREETITSNGTLTISPSSGFDAMNNATVNVNVPNRTTTRTITSNGTYRPSSSYIGFSSVTVNVPNSTTTKTINSNGTYTPESPYIGFNKVTVSVNNQVYSKNIVSNGTYTPASSYIGFSSVKVNTNFSGYSIYAIGGSSVLQFTSFSTLSSGNSLNLQVPANKYAVVIWRTGSERMYYVFDFIYNNTSSTFTMSYSGPKIYYIYNYSSSGYNYFRIKGSRGDFGTSNYDIIQIPFTLPTSGAGYKTLTVYKFFDISKLDNLY